MSYQISFARVESDIPLFTKLKIDQMSFTSKDTSFFNLVLLYQ